MRCTELTFTDATRYFTAFVANEFNIIYILFNIISVCFNIYIIIIIRFNNPLDSASSLLYGHALTNFNLSILPAINRYRNIIMYIIYIMFQYYFHLLYNSIFYFSINHTIIIIIQSFIMQSFIYYLLILLYLVIISKPKSLSIYDLSSLVAISFSRLHFTHLIIGILFQLFKWNGQSGLTIVIDERGMVDGAGIRQRKSQRWER
jgi:hypothetical protein